MAVKRRPIGRNAAALYAGEMASRVLFVALTILIARLLGANNLGRLVFATSLAGIVQVISDFGLTVYLVRTLSKTPEARRELLPSIATLRFAAAAVAGTVAMAYAFATISDGTLLATTAFAVGFVLLGVYSDYVFSLYRVEEAMVYEGVGKLANSVAYAGGGVALVAAGSGVAAVTAWSCLVALCTDIYAWRIYRGLRGFRAKPALRTGRLRQVFIESLPFGILAILTTISFRIDSLMIQLIRGTTDVGLYGAAYRTMEFLLIVPTILGTAILPVIARSIDHDAPSVLRLVNNSIRLLWSLAFPLAVGLGFLGGELLAGVFGSRFEQAHTVLVLLAATLVPLFASGMTSVVIAAGARPQANTWIAAGMVVLNIGLNAVLIPAIGINGAGVATLATEGAGLVAGAIFIARRHGSIAWHRCALKPLVASAAMGGSIALLDSRLAAIPVYIVVYLAVLVLLRGVTREDLKLLRGTMSPSTATEAVAATEAVGHA